MALRMAAMSTAGEPARVAVAGAVVSGRRAVFVVHPTRTMTAARAKRGGSRTAPPGGWCGRIRQGLDIMPSPRATSKQTSGCGGGRRDAPLVAHLAAQYRQVHLRRRDLVVRNRHDVLRDHDDV